MIQEILIGCGGCAVGCMVAWAACRSRISGLQVRLNSAQSRLAERAEDYVRESAAKEDFFKRLLAERERAHAEAMGTLKVGFEESMSKMKAELETSTAEIIRRRQADVDAAGKESLDKVLRPLNHQIEEVRKVVSENTTRHSEFEGQLKNALAMVLEHSDAARKSADRLADALHGNSATQGYWGETVLKELLQMQGLQEGVHFHTQVTMTDENGHPLYSNDHKTLIPDVILNLDRELAVVIDAKVSLTAWLDYMNAVTDDQRASALKAHVASIEAQVNRLAGKDYSSYIRAPKKSVDYVIMFVPNTGALYAATSAKPDLWRKAMAKRVYIADEQTLYAALKIIEMTWRQIAQADNQKEVYDLAGEMLARVSKFVETYSTLDKNLRDARKNFDEGLAKLQDSGHSIPVTCRKLIKLGTKATTPKKTLPGVVIDRETVETDD